MTALTLLRRAGCLLLLFTMVVAHRAVAESQADGKTVSAVLVSDIHLDPFYDPAKAKLLVAAPVSEWEAILGGPESPGRAEAFAALQKSCGIQSEDTTDLLFQSSLHAMRAQGAHARFVLVSGDLIAHQFPCRFRIVVPDGTPEEYSAFVEKTIDYVLTGLRRSLPGAPVYAALGNNDSGCEDYRMDAGGGFLHATATVMLRSLPKSAEKRRALDDFAQGGYYSAALSAPMQRTRLIVLNDVFLSRNYAMCEGKPDPTAAEAELAWLQKQLAGARAHHQRVWVMGHIPPGVDIHVAALHLRSVCEGAPPQMFLRSEKLAETLERYADVVRLGIFAHTHMDELRLLAPDGATPKQMVAIKMAPSITPVHGNNPAFLVARIDPALAELKDYSVFVASNGTGVGTTWSKEYTYSEAYHESAFAPAEVAHLVDEFARDPEAESSASRAFIRYFYAGDTLGLIKPLWPEYVCALGHADAAAFSKCACSAVKRREGDLSTVPAETRGPAQTAPQD